MTERAIPLFPLQTVLFPDGALSLRIFETRYVDMVGRCLREGSGFGVLLWVTSPEVEVPSTHVATIGTAASINDFDRLDDGLLGLTCRGGQRFKVHHHWQQEDGLYMAHITDLPPDPVEPIPDDCTYLSFVLKQLNQDVPESVGIGPARYEDAGWVANRLAEIIAVDLNERQRLLEMTDPIARLRALGPHIRIASTDG